jgi:hypothetical protein
LYVGISQVLITIITNTNHMRSAMKNTYYFMLIQNNNIMYYTFCIVNENNFEYYILASILYILFVRNHQKSRQSNLTL